MNKANSMWMKDRDYLKDQQYRVNSNLSARVRLHQLYSSNPVEWSHWVFVQVSITPGSSILELGCGYGVLWVDQVNQIPPDARIMMSDLSLGMVAEASRRLKQSAVFRFLEADAQNIPYEDQVFDLVIANHMLYHVPDIQAALSEIRRVLKPGGRLAAATNGSRHLVELDALIHTFEPAYQVGEKDPLGFSLENAGEILSPFFSHVDLIHYEDHLWVTEPGPLADYFYSLPEFSRIVSIERRTAVIDFLQERINADRGIFIQKDTGIVIAS